MNYPALAQTAQTIGVLLIAVLQWPMVRVIGAAYLRYWAWAFVSLAISLTALTLPIWFRDLNVYEFRLPARIAYFVGEYAFAFLVWAGTRLYVSGVPISRRDLYWFVPLGAYAIGAPFVFGLNDHGIKSMFAWHALILSVFFVATFWESTRSPAIGKSTDSFRVFQFCIAGLWLMFAHYGLVILLRTILLPNLGLDYLTMTSLVDGILEAGLSFGMVTVAAERMRSELERTNRKLAFTAEQLAMAARTDPLTGLHNRRAFDDLLNQSDRIHAGYLAALDMNDLKHLNDTYGHETGDIALKLLARALRNHFRVTDPIFRFGGDEFVVLMPGGSLEELTRRMVSLERTLQAQRLPGVDRPVDIVVSWGLTKYSSQSTLVDALREADEAMYEQKKKRKQADSAFPMASRA